jgi:predicted amidohydrolase
MYNKILFILVLLIVQPFEGFALESGRIALVQYNSDIYFGNYDLNKKNLTKMFETAIQNHSNIIVFPEGSLYGYDSRIPKLYWCLEAKKDCYDVNLAAEEVPLGKSTEYWVDLATKNKVYVLFNLPEKSNGQYYNTTVIVGPKGYIGKYRKRELFSADKLYAKAGIEDFILKTEFGNFGLLICRDVTFPGNLEKYSEKGVDAAILMTDWGFEKNTKYFAKNFFSNRATEANLTIYASDGSLWDGTGKYVPREGRYRKGLPADGSFGIDGISYHEIGEQRIYQNVD